MESKQTLLIERVMDQTRLAVIEDGALCELYIQRPDSENLTGNIYLGRVENVLPGMNAAFVDIGMEKNGFLVADDIWTQPGEAGDKKARVDGLVRPGAQLMVQVVKAQPGAKGPRLSGNITLPGRLMALMPRERSVGVSRKLLDEDERARLYEIGRALLTQGQAGVILRTAAKGASEDALRGEYQGLMALWREISVRAEHGVAPRLLYDDNSLFLRAVRDRLGERVEAIWADGIEEYETLRSLADGIAPEWKEAIRLHDGQTPLFDLYRVDAQADRALQKRVWLNSGGTLVIEETEAFTAVDVNTGKNVGGNHAEQTILENNLEAARELMRQLRLRDIGGIIVADFIDMADAVHKEALLKELRRCAAGDSNRTTVVDITALGLVELTRKKARQSLNRQLTHACSHCGGDGTEFSHEATARRAIRDIWRRRRGGDGGALLCEAAPQVCGHISSIGVPAGGAVYVCSRDGASAGEYRLTPADLTALPKGSKLLK